MRERERERMWKSKRERVECVCEREREREKECVCVTERDEQLDHECKAEPRLCDRQPDGAFTVQLFRFQGAWLGDEGPGVATMSENENHIFAIVSVEI